jgi:ATP-binding protein involved in chromosome partitioning
MNITIDKVKEALSNVIEPDLKKDIVQLNLVSDIEISGNKVSFTIKVSNPAMHNKKRMEDACSFAIERVLGKEVKTIVNVTGLPTDRSPELRKILPSVKNIIAIASGKGGVGKSTVAANMAAGLALRGYAVGLVDADIYGPSQHIMFDVAKEKPMGKDMNGKTYLLPVESYGVKLLSLGFFSEPDQAIVWRGAMASKALNQLFSDAWWGPLDYMIVDLPPGTGDIHLSLVQAVPLTGAIIVSTPQNVALADASRAVGMFQLEAIKVPVLGIIENMAYFTPAELPENKYYLFGKSGAKGLSEKLNIPFLGEIPLVQSICESGDAGRPAVLQNNTPVSNAFNQIIDKFVIEIENRNIMYESTKVVKMNH